MGVVRLEEKQATTDIKEWLDAYISEDKRRGKVAVMLLDESGRVRHKFYAHHEREQIKKHFGEINTYLSLNAFGAQGKKTRTYRRRAEDVVQIRNIGIDLDCYNEGLTVEDTEEALLEMIENGIMPEPNVVIRSGSGVQLVYSIEGGAPASLAWLTQHITLHLILKTSKLGSDPSCNDLARVFRLPNTYNQKPQKMQRYVTAGIWRHRQYDLSELYAFCEPVPHRKPPGTSTRPERQSLPKISEGGHKLRRLNQTRLNDFYKLIDLRGGEIEKRNVMTYDFAYILGLMTDSERDVVLQAQRFNSCFKVPQDFNVVDRTARSAFEDAREFWTAYSDNHYSMKGLCRDADGLKKPKKNSTIIQAHNITAEEMKSLSTLIGKEESYSRKVAKRRENGVKERAEYEKERQKDKQQKIEELRRLMAENPKMKQKEIAELMGVDRKTISRWSKEL